MADATVEIQQLRGFIMIVECCFVVLSLVFGAMFVSGDQCWTSS